jgi:hypothetical protein
MPVFSCSGSNGASGDFLGDPLSGQGTVGTNCQEGGIWLSTDLASDSISKSLPSFKRDESQFALRNRSPAMLNSSSNTIAMA